MEINKLLSSNQVYSALLPKELISGARKIKQISVEGKELPLKSFLTIHYVDEQGSETLLMQTEEIKEKNTKFENFIEEIPFHFHLVQILQFSFTSTDVDAAVIDKVSVPLTTIIQGVSETSCTYQVRFQKLGETSLVLGYSFEEKEEGLLQFDMFYKHPEPFRSSVRLQLNLKSAHSSKDPELDQEYELHGYVEKGKNSKVKGSFEFTKKNTFKDLTVDCKILYEGFLTDFCCKKWSVLFPQQVIGLEEIVAKSGGEITHKIKFPNTGNSVPTLDASLHFVNIRYLKFANFLEFFENGLEISLGLAIDFTNSTADPSDPSSLHFTKGGTIPSPYEKALQCVTRTLLQYDSDKKVPMWGFGGYHLNSVWDKGTYLLGTKSQSLFNMKIKEGVEACGVEDVLSTYRDVVSHVKLSSPTKFTPVFEEMFRYIKSRTDDLKKRNQYFILTILTGGRISDEGDTINAIVEASHTMPLSVLIVGVGEGPFEKMEKLDSNGAKLRSRQTGKEMRRDIVQFTEFRENESRELFKMRVLDELPRQVSTYFANEGLKPSDLSKFK